MKAFIPDVLSVLLSIGFGGLFAQVGCVYMWMKPDLIRAGSIYRQILTAASAYAASIPIYLGMFRSLDHITGEATVGVVIIWIITLFLYLFLASKVLLSDRLKR